ncbi:MAG: microcin transport system substrate-binding protein [Alphaproteobacteria bacterium]|nr:microcin transport system substrate-binding protein [Alphaproteobacteria bacterium]
MNLTRRTILQTGVFALAAPSLSIIGATPLAAQGIAEADAWRHGFSTFGDVHYPAGFKHFDYVNPNAPKGGVVRLVGNGTFDNFNVAVAGLKGTAGLGLGLLFDTLMVDALDEVSNAYGLLAEALRYPADYSSAAYRLRAEARWHDGKPVTPEDVIFSFDILKKQSPMYNSYYRHVTKAEKTGEREVTFTFDSPGNRELPLIVGQLLVLPKHWWEGTDASGNKRDITVTSLEPPLGNGAYRMKSFEAGRRIVYERVPDYWGKDINVNIGRDNFDEMRFEYFRDLSIALEGFKGDQLDWQYENSAKNWATAYDFPAVKEKRVLLEEFPIRSEGRMQGFAFNIRRDKFKDPRVRRAFNFAYDFEEMNKQLSFGQYKRIGSYFDGLEIASSGLPQGKELEILQTVREQVPAEVFTTVYTNPVGGNPEAVRNNLREGARLLKEAGYEIRNRRLVNAKTGEPFTAEFLVQDPAFERFAIFYKPSLERLGIEMNLRIVDDAQYQNRMRNWDFDITVSVWPQSLTPGNEQRDFWSSQSADRPGSFNYIGIKNPAVDTLIDRVVFAKDREELAAAVKALDRVLLWNHYVVPQFNYDKDRTARWDRFSHPDLLPKYASQAAFPTIWWWDAAKAAKTGTRS